MIRMALDGAPGLQALAFDLARRKLTAWHSGGPEAITAILQPLRLGAELVQSEKCDEPPPASAMVDAQTQARVLWILLAINAVMFLVELIGGWLVESTGLIADSLDMFADATVYGISLFAVGRSARLKLGAARVNGSLQML
ncbi:MAG: cation transporter, partial [bacterium]